MKTKRPALPTALFLAALLTAFLLADALAAAVLPPFFRRCGRFSLNDFELTQKAHPEEVWDKVFFGSSVVIAGYREEESGSGYVNLGMDDATVRDLRDLLAGGYLTVGSQLVVGVNELTLYDGFPTNPYYIWHKSWYEPYVYFARTRIRTLLEETAVQALGLGSPSYGYLKQEKSYYWGSLSQAELEAKLSSESYSRYLDIPEEGFDENFAALEYVADWCGEHGVRLRLVFMPGNPSVPQPLSRDRAFARLSAFCAGRGLELLDLRSAFGPDCFYDTGHLNREYGSHRFTKEIDPWLNS